MFVINLVVKYSYCFKVGKMFLNLRCVCYENYVLFSLKFLRFILSDMLFFVRLYFLNLLNSIINYEVII